MVSEQLIGVHNSLVSELATLGWPSSTVVGGTLIAFLVVGVVYPAVWSGPERREAALTVLNSLLVCFKRT
ncbi:hypothetical protein [Nocardiopsis sp. FIRDI 009]|uniref:hypothetical protein n=1 Tax=Nocardiopsis sp. FIRDI 009 TaxID=714197 RepID=UPI000E25C10E|nr:hypothetical protein [Nocardiopsis sp. FIRDI 009]